ncbi:MAG: pyridoxamine 5'-phosphate oxidase family protein [Oscillospiraceae bacterium]
MRRTDREVTDPAEIAEMMTRCEVLHLALNTDTVPYILPVNFGMEPDGMTLYIHGVRGRGRSMP